jgi:hypothetical protein
MENVASTASIFVLAMHDFSHAVAAYECKDILSPDIHAVL